MRLDLVNYECVPYTHISYLQECIASSHELIWNPSIELASSLGVRGRRVGEEVSGYLTDECREFRLINWCGLMEFAGVFSIVAEFLRF